MAGAPWYALRCVGDPATRAIPYLAGFGLETYYPIVREHRAVPKRMLSRDQRRAGLVIMRPAKVPLLPAVVFVRGEPRGDLKRIVDAGALAVGMQVSERVIRPVDWDDVVGNTPYLRGYLCIGDEPAQIRDAWLEELRAREVDGAIAGATPARMLFRIGERVRITDGPFTSFPGIIEEVPDVAIEDIDGDTRVGLLIDIFGRLTKAKADAWQIEKT